MPNSDERLDNDGREVWSRLSDGLISGVHHALNNRMAALGAVAQVIEADIPANHPLSGAVGNELQRLESTVGLLSLLVDGREAEPVQVEAVFDQLSQLVAVHHALRDLRLDGAVAEGLFPLWINPAALLRGLLVMVAAAGVHARQRGGTVRIRATGDSKEVNLFVEAPGERQSAESVAIDLDDDGLDDIDAGNAAELLEEWGGELKIEESDGGLFLRATLPTLPEARNREKVRAS